jgi:hypothetical protein
MRTVENTRDRVELARDAGLPQLSFISALAGTMVAYGTSIVVVAVVAGLAARVSTTGSSTLTSYDWRQIGGGSAAVLGRAMLLSYLLGGYVAGRMARRSGLLNGFFVFALGIAIVGVAAGVIGSRTGGGTLLEGLRRVGIPTTRTEWGHFTTLAGIASIAAMLVGSLVGGVLGERWHGKLLTRALDPEIGPEAELRAAIAEARARRAEREANLSALVSGGEVGFEETARPLESVGRAVARARLRNVRRLEEPHAPEGRPLGRRNR